MQKPPGTPPDDAVDSEMVRYYAARADEYDDWYMRRARYSHGRAHDEAWRRDLGVAAGWLANRPFEGRIVELAAGTGWWSPLLAAKGQLTLYDAAPEPLVKARLRPAAAGLKAEMGIRDAWAEPDSAVEGLFAGFWVSHIDRARLDEWLTLAARWLAPGGLLALIDSCQDPESGARNDRPPGDDIPVRLLDDGTSFRIRKVFYEPAELEASLERAGFDQIEVTKTEHFFLVASARRR